MNKTPDQRDIKTPGVADRLNAERPTAFTPPPDLKPVYTIHPTALVFPAMQPAERQELKASIQQHGQLHPIITSDGKVIDGRHRYEICLELGIKPKTIDFEEYQKAAGIKLTVEEFIFDSNMKRRHLTTGQRAAIAAEFANMRQGERTDLKPSANLPKVSQEKVSHKKATEPWRNSAKVSQSKAAELLKVSRDSVKAAKKVKEKAPETFAKVKAGEVSLNAAVESLAPEAPAKAMPEAKVKEPDIPEPANKHEDWLDSEILKDKECLEQINAPSTFPTEAPIPQDNHPDTQGLRAAIEWLKAEESKIANYREKHLYQMLLRTNRIQAYQVNWLNYPRPDGKLDQRILDWASDLWRRQQRQHDRINIRSAVRTRRKAKAQTANPPSTTPADDKDLPFEDCFNRIIDTSLKCPCCHGPIFHGRGKAAPEIPLRQIYSCSCLALDTKRFDNIRPFTVERWETLAKDWSGRLGGKFKGIALPPIGFIPTERARRVKESYNPEEHAKLYKSRKARWESALADARDAIEELAGIQERFKDWQDNLPENFRGSALEDKLDVVCGLSFDDALNAIEEAEEADLPLGFGRD